MALTKEEWEKLEPGDLVYYQSRSNSAEPSSLKLKVYEKGTNFEDDIKLNFHSNPYGNDILSSYHNSLDRPNNEWSDSNEDHSREFRYIWPASHLFFIEKPKPRKSRLELLDV